MIKRDEQAELLQTQWRRCYRSEGERAGQGELLQSRMEPQAQLVHVTGVPVIVPDSAWPRCVPSSGASALDSLALCVLTQPVQQAP